MSREYIEIRCKIQSKLLDFLENEDDNETKFQNFLKILEEENIIIDQNNFREFLNTLAAIINNHHCNIQFFQKIELILQHFKSQINKYFTNNEIFNIFKENKRILLFLINEKMIDFNRYIFSQLNEQKSKYIEFFRPEINQLNVIEDDTKEEEDEEEEEEEELEKKPKIDYELPYLLKNRLIGENESYLCTLIRDDNIDEFIQFINKMNISISNATIRPSIFETNSFLINKKLTILQYATFHGSIKIIQYFHVNNIKFDSSLWLYAIHSNNAEIISFIEENVGKPDDNLLMECFKESIKCHHNEIANYIQMNYFEEEINYQDIFLISLKYYNFAFMKDIYVDKSFLFDYIEYGYNYFAKLFLDFVGVNKVKKVILLDILK